MYVNKLLKGQLNLCVKLIKNYEKPYIHKIMANI